ncbi:hypothetical protein PPTG_20705 [Phytophthora nicotianae INRA-310]|uniref:Uncharacterized protein n=1 Tax=Phytophthora nicotianae (strain INRA-310) TaxID=761204 RepID=W2RGM2_PHYN3|nr:hypothetical protein PPTG_20705 [Phytophthora nicotianae INRA-310]ETN23769.1 hypothetical protein PPTG_20705 [Phytophthora nicotianae INRA-310]
MMSHHAANTQYESLTTSEETKLGVSRDILRQRFL